MNEDWDNGMRGPTLFPTNMANAATGRNVMAYQQGKITQKKQKGFGVK
ncbi:MAG: hypothetical protein CM1200mP10_08190 [Candidatus Neomarinimicrobiota bacterium]|nr:MAG: hypothetical protein CM1200mP10_08190 [Candidatus Neomarinimicrobiota bacterium]